MLASPFRIGVDIGGTFTDLVLVDRNSEIRPFKVPSVRANPAEGVLAAVEKAAAYVDCTVEKLLQDTELFVHGSTVATNTLLEGKGAKVGLLVTEGFRDSLEFRRASEKMSGITESPTHLCSSPGTCGCRYVVAWKRTVPYAPHSTRSL